MGKNIQLSIAEPCHENWNKMTPAQQGRFCGSCQKEVVDFTNMSDAEVATFFKKPSAGSVCGRFMKDQLERDIAIPEKRIPWVKYFFQFTLPLFLMGLKANAQKGKVVVKTETSPVVCTQQPALKMGEIAIREDPKLRGQVVDEEGKPVPFASIITKGTLLGAPADSTGQFSFAWPAGKDSMALSISSVGFSDKEVVVSLQETMNNNRMIIRLEKIMMPEVLVTAWTSEWRTEVMGGISIVESGCTRIAKKSEKSAPVINTPVSKPAVMKVYPNPVVAGSPIHIDCSKLEESYYTFQLLTLSGQTATQQQIWIDKDARILNMPLPKVAAGTYLVNMISRQSGKTFANKIVIE